MTVFSEDEPTVPAEFKEKHGLDGNWEVRFTAQEIRAREMAAQYQTMGHEVRVLPLQPENEMLETEELKQFSDDLDLDHDPLQYIEDDSCNTCLDQTYVVFTKDDAEADASGDDDLVYDADE